MLKILDWLLSKNGQLLDIQGEDGKTVEVSSVACSHHLGLRLELFKHHGHSVFCPEVARYVQMHQWNYRHL